MGCRHALEQLLEAALRDRQDVQRIPRGHRLPWVHERCDRADLYLISTHEPRGSFEPSDTVPIDELRASLHRVLGADLPFTDATAIRSTVDNSCQADVTPGHRPCWPATTTTAARFARSSAN